MIRRAATATLLVALLCAGAGAPPARGATGNYEPHTALVGFTAGTPEALRAKAHADLGARVLSRFDDIDLDVVRLPDGIEPSEGSINYRREPGVAYAHPNWSVHLLSVPNDPRFSDEWGLNNTGQFVSGSSIVGASDADIDAPEGWDTAFGSGSFPSAGGTVVGVIDTGVDTGHPDLSTKIASCVHATSGSGAVSSGCTDDHGHGTHVSGTIGAVTNNGIGVAGVAPNARLAEFKALSGSGQGYYADLIAGMNWLTNTGGARVISMSLGGPADSALASQVNASYAAGVLLVAAAGNDGNGTTTYPAGYANVVSVGAVDARGAHASFSNCNADVELSAPGVDIWSTWPGGYARLNGTSMATPHVAGVAAMVMSGSSLNNVQTRQVLDDSADDLGASGRDTCYGFGRVNLGGALAKLGPVITAPPEGAWIASTTPPLAGSAPANAVVTVREGASTVGTPTADATGRWSLPATFGEGSHAITASALVGGSTVTTPDRHFTVDVTAPATPSFTAPAAGATIASNIVSVAGAAGEPLATVDVIEGTNILASVTANSFGNFSGQVTVGSGPHSIVAISRDRAGNVSVASPERSFTAAPVAGVPDPPVLRSPEQGSMVQRYFDVSGTAPPNTSILLYDGTAYVGGAASSSGGTWSSRIRSAGTGIRQIRATATDTSHNVSPLSQALTLTVDDVAPTVSWITTNRSVFALSTHLSGMAADDYGVGRVEIVYRRSAGSTETGGTSCPACGPTPGSVQWTADPDLQPGLYTAIATAYDLVGNASATASIQIIVI